MKNKRLITLSVLILGLAGGWFAIHQAQAQTKTDAGETAKRADEQYQRMLDEQAGRFKRAEQMMVRQEELMKQQEEAFKRYVRILETWEKQQQQYQKYLDSLEKK